MLASTEAGPLRIKSHSITGASHPNSLGFISPWGKGEEINQVRDNGIVIAWIGTAVVLG